MTPIKIDIERFDTNPLITTATSPTLGDSINGPSVIRLPGWVPNPLGTYYMYFAHHSGTHIRLAYADDLQGPWTIHEPGALKITGATLFHDHIASPDVHVDDTNKQIRMYFHGVARRMKGQWTGVATSADGIHFAAAPAFLGKFYFRVWEWEKHWYAIAKNNNDGWGELYRSDNPMKPFTLRGNFIEGMRHAAVKVEGHLLYIFYSRVGDVPERILVSTVDMRPDWRQWVPSEPVEVLKPTMKYEGAEYQLVASDHGAATNVNQLRDPFVFDDGGNWTLFYTMAGENGICGAKIVRA